MHCIFPAINAQLQFKASYHDANTIHFSRLEEYLIFPEPQHKNFSNFESRVIPKLFISAKSVSPPEN